MRAVVSIALASLLVSLPTGAAELELGTRVDVQYSDNVLSDPGDKNSDVSLRFAPDARVIERNGELQWEVFYRPAFVGYLDTSDIDGWEHDFRGNLRWQIDERTSLTVSDTFSRLLSRGRFNELVTLEGGDTVTEVDFRVNDYERNAFTASLLRQIDAGHSIQGTFSHSLTNFDESRDTSGFSAVLSWIYQYSPRTVLSVGPRYSRQFIEGVGTTEDSETDFYGLTGSIRHLFDRGLVVSLSAGPSWIDSNQDRDPVTTVFVNEFPTITQDGQPFLVGADSCSRLDDGALFFSQDCESNGSIPSGSSVLSIPVEPGAPSVSQTRLTFFASASIAKQWRLWSARLGYTRQESPSSGLGAASITDTLTSSVSWRPAERWNLNWSLSFTRRSQATETLQPLILIDRCPIAGSPAACLGPDLMPVPDGTARSRILRLDILDTDDRIDQFSGQFFASYRLRKRIRLNVNLYYLDQSQNSDRFVVNRDVERFTVSIGLRWDLDPIPL